MSIVHDIEKAIKQDGSYRLFRINKDQIPNRFFRVTSGKYYLVNGEIILVKTTITHSRKASNGSQNRQAIFFTENKYTKNDLAKYLANKKNSISNYNNIKIIVSQETKDFDSLVKYIKKYAYQENDKID